MIGMIVLVEESNKKKCMERKTRTEEMPQNQSSKDDEFMGALFSLSVLPSVHSLQLAMLCFVLVQGAGLNYLYGRDKQNSII